MIDLLIDQAGCHIEAQHYQCSIGKAGFVTSKIEGDNGTPIGRFPLREVLYRPDRLIAPKTALPVSPLSPTDGWCDDPQDKNYNSRISLPYNANHEELWRQDHLYDIIVVVGYNDSPPQPGKGSAIFLHLARENYTPTQGCVAFHLKDLLAILQKLSLGSHIDIQG